MKKNDSHDPRAYLFDMLESARKVREYVEGISYEQFWESSAIRDAVSLRLAMIGEAAKKIDVSTQKKLPGIPFAQIGGLRNHIVHDYGAIDFKQVWKVSGEYIFPLIEIIEKYLKENDSHP